MKIFTSLAAGFYLVIFLLVLRISVRSLADDVDVLLQPGTLLAKEFLNNVRGLETMILGFLANSIFYGLICHVVRLMAGGGNRSSMGQS
jgi:hypothetical protein